MGSPDIADGRSFPSDLVVLTAPLGEQAVDPEAPVFFWSPQDGRRVPQLIGGEKKSPVSFAARTPLASPPSGPCRLRSVGERLNGVGGQPTEDELLVKFRVSGLVACAAMF